MSIRSLHRKPPSTRTDDGGGYFDVEEDDDDQSSSSSGGRDEHFYLTWRRSNHHADNHDQEEEDPVDSNYSDWTIVVVTNELDTRTYHVHKSILCFGPRQSKYFAKLMLNSKSTKGSFQTPPKQQHRQQQSIKVELDQRDAHNFETLLDFIYAPAAQQMRGNDGSVLTAASTLTSPSLFSLPANYHHSNDDDNHSLQFTSPQQQGSASVSSAQRPSEQQTKQQPPQDDYVRTESAVSLRYLARRFEVDSLILHVNRFIQRDLNIRTGPYYLTRGYEYRDDKLMASARTLCADNFDKLCVEDLMSLPVPVFRIMVKSLESFEKGGCGDDRGLSEFLSHVVYGFMDAHANDPSLSGTAELLLEFTDPMVMPYIASEPAIGFTALVKKLESSEASRHWDRLVLLCRRCARSVVKEYGWNDFSVNAAVDEYLGNSLAHKRVSRVDSLLFATSFSAALEQAQDDFEELMLEQERLDLTIKALNSSITAMEAMNDRKNAHMTQQQEVLEDAKAQIAQLKQQVTAIKNAQQHQLAQRTKAAMAAVSYTSACQPQPTVRFSPEPARVLTDAAPPQQRPQAPSSSDDTTVANNNTSDQQNLVSLKMVVVNNDDDENHQGQGRCFTTEEIVRDLISPSEVEGAILALRQSRRQKEQKTREELRTKKSLV